MKTRITSILVPIDFSRGSAAALRFAKVMARQTGATLALVNVIDDVTMPDLWPAAHTPSVPEIRDAMADGARQKLSRLCNAAGDLPMIWDVMFGVPAAVIVRRAKQRSYDLVIIGTHGRTGVRRLLMGSVAERVARLSPCPVVLVRDRRPPSRVIGKKHA